MARHTPLTSFKKRPRSLRLAFANVLSGGIFARLVELEERVVELEHRANAQADAIAHLGATVAVKKKSESTVSRVLHQPQKHMESSDGKLSKNTTETNGLRSDIGFFGSRSNSHRSEHTEAGINHFSHHTVTDDTPARKNTCFSGWDVSGHDSGASCDTGSSSCCD
ncbi:hypothetical protein ACOB7R_003763 [Enterobacter hormaechei]